MIAKTIFKLSAAELQKLFREKLTKKQHHLLKEIKLLHKDWQQIITEKNRLQNTHNNSSRQYSQLLKLATTNSITLQKLQKNNSNLKKKIIALEITLNLLKQKITRYLSLIPNPPLKEVPSGMTATANKIVAKWGEIKQQHGHDHKEIMTKLQWADFERATKLSGTRFIIYQKEGAKLKRAIVNYLLTTARNNGYQELDLPVLVKEHCLYNTGQLPKFNDDLYFTADGYYLIPTAEVSLINTYAGEILAKKELPIKLVAFSSCFRREAGAAGKINHGILRMHQFHKVELIKITEPKTANNELWAMVTDVKKLLQDLKIPGQITELCTGQLGFSAAQTYDINVWMPGQKRYCEISSCSNCTDFQSRRAAIKYHPDSGSEKQKTKHPYIINGSGVAIDRLIAAIVENYYDAKTGQVNYPPILQKFF